MKRLFIAILVLGFVGTALSLPSSVIQLTTNQLMKRAIPELTNLEWEVGEFQERRIKSGALQVGTLITRVDRNEGDAMWLVNELKIILKKKQVIEILMDRATGEIIRYIEDGEEKAPPALTNFDDCEDLGEKLETVRVPAGKFKTIRTILSCPDENLALWVNNNEVNMNGQVQQAVLMDAEDPESVDYLIQLTKFGKK